MSWPVLQGERLVMGSLLHVVLELFTELISNNNIVNQFADNLDDLLN